MKNGFFEGRGGAGEPSGRVEGLERPFMKSAKEDGVRAVASAGGGRPVILAIRVRNHLIRVKIPRADPKVLRRFPNCSATETMAGKLVRRVCGKERMTYRKMSCE